MSDKKEQIARIREMERRFERVAAAVKRLSKALDKWEEVQESLAALEAYYGSDVWKQDFADDEAGLLPEGLKRGVLSEDGIWNLLAECKEMREKR